MDHPTPILDTGHGELPPPLIAAAPVHATVTAEQAGSLVGPVNAVLALHAPIVRFEDADNVNDPDECGHCGDPISEGHYRDGWYSNLLCPKNPTLWCNHCSDGQGGYADWPCATVKALGVEAPLPEGTP
ncbi:hypothetical protein ABZ234_03475 [Nocardiopsis sp. NPDC006198]|uniref:hypothetical protein n=1 Tax=Nocardiopsis sp. NPDC006198 TaxID=3154472 RepID=UPI0033A2406F